MTQQCIPPYPPCSPPNPNPQPQVKGRVESQLKIAIRVMYSSPPIHGAAIATMVLSNPALSAEWQAELAGMAGRITAMRTALVQALQRAGAPGNWDHITSQVGGVGG